jgi:carbonic anhydrase
MDQHMSISRRHMIAAAAAAAAWTFSRREAARAAETTPAAETDALKRFATATADASPDEVLARLVEGNRRFASGRSSDLHRSLDRRAELVDGQRPVATLLACSDSRVPPELVFDQGLGDLFTIRVAGNVIDTDVVGSIEYALAHLRTPLLMVLGHERCGAVKAALEADSGAAREPSGLARLVAQIKPALAGLPEGAYDARLSAAVAANVRQSLRKIERICREQRLLEKNDARLVGAVYDLASGQVRVLDS